MDTTSWRVILEAGAGEQTAKDEFVARYSGVARAYFCARWKGTALTQEVEDAVQQVFIECFREQGVLTRVAPGRVTGFRAYFHGVLRGCVVSPPSTRYCLGLIPTTPPHVLFPISGPSFNILNPCEKISPSEPANSFVKATIGPPTDSHG